MLKGQQALEKDIALLNRQERAWTAMSTIPKTHQHRRDALSMQWTPRQDRERLIANHCFINIGGIDMKINQCTFRNGNLLTTTFEHKGSRGIAKEMAHHRVQPQHLMQDLETLLFRRD